MTRMGFFGRISSMQSRSGNLQSGALRWRHFSLALAWIWWWLSTFSGRLASSRGCLRVLDVLKDVFFDVWIFKEVPKWCFSSNFRSNRQCEIWQSNDRNRRFSIDTCSSDELFRCLTRLRLLLCLLHGLGCLLWQNFFRIVFWSGVFRRDRSRAQFFTEFSSNFLLWTVSAGTGSEYLIR